LAAVEHVTYPPILFIELKRQLTCSAPVNAFSAAVIAAPHAREIDPTLAVGIHDRPG
jgi:hypothetical protein